MMMRACKSVQQSSAAANAHEQAYRFTRLPVSQLKEAACCLLLSCLWARWQGRREATLPRRETSSILLGRSGSGADEGGGRARAFGVVRSVGARDG